MKKRRTKQKKDYPGRVFVFVSRSQKGKVDDISRIVKSHNMTINEIKIDGRGYLRKLMKEKSGSTDPPQIFFNSKYVGGYDEVMELEKKGELKGMLEKCKQEEPGDLYTPYRKQNEIFSLHPPKLYFPRPENHTIVCVLRLHNRTEHPALFKMKTTQPRKYAVRPKCGSVAAGGTEAVEITLKRTTEYEESDKFLLESLLCKTYKPEMKAEIPSIFKQNRPVRQKLFCDFGEAPPRDIKLTQIRDNEIRVEEDLEGDRERRILAERKKQFEKEREAERLRREAEMRQREKEREQRKLEDVHEHVVRTLVGVQKVKNAEEEWGEVREQVPEEVEEVEEPKPEVEPMANSVLEEKPEEMVVVKEEPKEEAREPAKKVREAEDEQSDEDDEDEGEEEGEVEETDEKVVEPYVEKKVEEPKIEEAKLVIVEETKIREEDYVKLINELKQRAELLEGKLSKSEDVFQDLRKEKDKKERDLQKTINRLQESLDRATKASGKEIDPNEKKDYKVSFRFVIITAVVFLIVGYFLHG